MKYVFKIYLSIRSLVLRGLLGDWACADHDNDTSTQHLHPLLGIES